jgi:hypothetical protein
MMENMTQKAVEADRLYRDQVFEIGETCWFHGEGGTVEGTVVHVTQIPGYGFPHYIIAVPTGIDDLLYVRSGCWLEMKKEKPKDYDDED